jgi:SHS2 domain-containing protein
MPYREIDHTAESGFIAEGATLAEVFADAAKALFEVVTDTSKVEPAVERRVTLEAEDAAELMHVWLEELHYMSETEHEFYGAFDVEATETGLSAVVRGEKVDPQKHELRSEIKAVTYGDYYFRKTADGYETRVVVDV